MQAAIKATERGKAKQTKNHLDGLTHTSTYALERPVLFKGVTPTNEEITHQSATIAVVFSIDPSNREARLLPADAPDHLLFTLWKEVAPIIGFEPVGWVNVSTTEAPLTVEGRTIERLNSIGFKKSCGCKNEQ